MENTSQWDVHSIKETLEKLLLSKLKKEVKIISIEKAGSGYHSDGFRLKLDNGQELFLKRIKSFDMGFEFPERKISSLLLSHSMSNRIKSSSNPGSIGIAIHDEDIFFLPEINEDTQIYQIQDFGGKGTSYSKLLQDKNKEAVDEIDKSEIDSVVDYLIQIHSIKHPSEDKKQLNAVYNDFVRNVIGHPEYLLLLLHEIPKDNVVLSPKDQGEFVLLMLEMMHYLKDRPERLRAIHGDFWGANLFFRKDHSIYVVDHSRMPWGDPGFDVGFWLSQYLINYHIYKKNYYKKLGEYFMQRYLEKTQDYGIFPAVIYSLGLISVMYASPKIVPNMDNKTREAIYNHTISMLKQKRFFWPEV